jgi:DNA-binding response OmpR family regulator
MKARILIVAEDAQLRAQLAGWLMEAGYAVELAESPKRAREVITNTDVALIIVAPNRVGISRLELAREFGVRDGQVLIIEEQTDEAGTSTKAPIRVNGYISKPLTKQDVLACVGSTLGAMLSMKERIAPQLISFEGYTLDAEGRTCTDAKGQEVMLTRAEFSLLFAFVRQPGRVLSRDDLSHAVAGRAAEPDDRSVDVLMSRLRRKIEPEPKAPRIIVTCRARATSSPPSLK